MKKRLLVVYHFFHPDDVVSARLFTEFAEELATRGWDVSVLTSNRYCRDRKKSIGLRDETWRGIGIHRSYRPAFDQASNLGRMANALWLMTSWRHFILRQPPFDAIVLGTDPQFGYGMVPVVKLFRRKTKIASWGFDIYPEAIEANRMGPVSKAARLFRPVARFCYRRLDGMVDIGPCMRSLLDRYNHKAKPATLTPWALEEPEAPLEPDPQTRERLFGKARIAVLYSGSIGRAHVFERLIALARELRRRNASIAFCFAGRGNRFEALKNRFTSEDANVSFAGFADEQELAKRLGAGDIHMISLREGWEGVVVPSKFFGAIAAGKPVLYEGPATSSIKRWIDQYGLGWTVDENNLTTVADMLCHLAERPERLKEKQEQAHRCYRRYFSKKETMDNWDRFLKELCA